MRAGQAGELYAVASRSGVCGAHLIRMDRISRRIAEGLSSTRTASCSSAAHGLSKNQAARSSNVRTGVGRDGRSGWHAILFALQSSRCRLPCAGFDQDPVSGPDVSPTLKRIELTIDVAGVHRSLTFAPQPNLNMTCLGRKMAMVADTGPGRDRRGLNYIYPLVYQTADRSVQRDGSVGLFASTERAEFRMHTEWHGLIGAWQPPASDLGGWSLNVQHTYDRATRHSISAARAAQRGLGQRGRHRDGALDWRDKSRGGWTGRKHLHLQ